MPCCFICNSTLYGERKHVCSSYTPHSNTLYPQKIAEILGEEFVMIANPDDYMCLKCTSLLDHLDKCETDAKLDTDVLVSKIKKTYEILPPDQAIKNVEIVNGHLMAEEQQEQGQSQLRNCWISEITSTASTSAFVTPIKTPFKLIKTQQQQQQQQQKRQQEQKKTNTTKKYKCAFCTFQSKELENVQFHSCNHRNNKKSGKPILNQAAARTLTLVPYQKKRLFRCQICSKIFDSRIHCFDHIKEQHIDLTTCSNGVRKIVRIEKEFSENNVNVKNEMSVLNMES